MTNDLPTTTTENEGIPVMAAPKPRPFFPSSKWKGAKPGYHFTNGSLGLGYYFDPKEQKKLQKLQNKDSTKSKQGGAEVSIESMAANVKSKKATNIEGATGTGGATEETKQQARNLESRCNSYVCN